MVCFGSGAVRGVSVRNGAVWCGAMQLNVGWPSRYSAVQYDTLQCKVAWASGQCNAVQGSMVCFGGMRCGAIWCDAVPCRTVPSAAAQCEVG